MYAVLQWTKPITAATKWNLQPRSKKATRKIKTLYSLHLYIRLSFSLPLNESTLYAEITAIYFLLLDLHFFLFPHVVATTPSHSANAFRLAMTEKAANQLNRKPCLVYKQQRKFLFCILYINLFFSLSFFRSLLNEYAIISSVCVFFFALLI